jgi:hypothetical protein
MMAVLPAGKAEANDTSTSTIVFESNGGYTLTDNGDGTYSGVIPCKVDGVFDIYAKKGAVAYFDDTSYTISEHDAWPDWNPDTPDWYQYSLIFYEEGGVQKWALRNHAGAKAAEPWYSTGIVAMGVPMSGIMNWVPCMQRKSIPALTFPAPVRQSMPVKQQVMAAALVIGIWTGVGVARQCHWNIPDLRSMLKISAQVTIVLLLLSADGPVKNLLQMRLTGQSNPPSMLPAMGIQSSLEQGDTKKLPRMDNRSETLGKLIDFVGETDGSGNPLPVIEGSLTISLDSGMNDNVSVSNLNFELLSPIPLGFLASMASRSTTAHLMAAENSTIHIWVSSSYEHQVMVIRMRPSPILFLKMVFMVPSRDT